MKKLCIGKTVRKLISCDRGAVAPLVGVCAIMLVGAVAVAVDIGRGQVAQSKLQAALDSAGLAAGAIVGQTLDEEVLEAEARKYLDANFAGHTVDATINLGDDGFDLDLSENEQLVTLSAKATLPTTFMKIFGHDTMQVAARTEITREMTGLEVVLVLDVTGSMCMPDCSKRDAMRSGALALVDDLLGAASEQNTEDLFIGIVPFSQAVNIGTTRTGWLSDWDARSAQDNCVGWTHANWSHTHSAGENPRYCPTQNPNVSTRTWPLTLVDDWMFNSKAGWYFQHAWGGCVEARHAGGEDVTDTPATEAGFPAYFAPDNGSNNDWRSSSGAYQVNSSRSANKGCPPSPVTPMTNNKATLDTAINNLNVAGYTMLPTGAAWGWRMLSPKWAGEWGGDMDANDLPLPYDEPLMDKVVVFMTDGDNDMPAANDPTYVAYGRLSDGYLGTTNEAAAQAELDARFSQICESMKAPGVGIKIYTISVGSGVSANGANLLRNCASLEAYYFHAADGPELVEKFKEVADALSKLRVSK